MKGLSFIVDNEYFAVDVNLVQKVARKMMITPIPSAPNEVIGITNLKGRVITIFSLNKLLNRKEYSTNDTAAFNAVIFKSFSDVGDYMGLHIDKPGDLIDIDDDLIQPPSLATGMEDSFCISGIVNVSDRLYRIISIDTIAKRYKGDGDLTAGSKYNKGVVSNERV